MADVLASPVRWLARHPWPRFLLGRLLVLLGGLVLISIVAVACVRTAGMTPICSYLCTESEGAFIPNPDVTGEPFLVDWTHWSLDALHGDLGTTQAGQPVSEVIAQRATATLQLLVLPSVAALAAAVLCVFALGRRSTGMGATVLRWVARVGVAMPCFVTWMLLFLHVVWPLTDRPLEPPNPQILFAVTVFPLWLAFLARRYPSHTQADHGWAARSSGASAMRAWSTGAGRLLVLDVVTVAGRWLPLTLGMVLLAEVFLAINGVGRFLVDSMYRLDYVALAGAFFVMCAFCLVANVLFDVVRAVLDPRVRRAGAGVVADPLRFERPHLAGLLGHPV